jgi:hypothetical protein
MGFNRRKMEDQRRTAKSVAPLQKLRQLGDVRRNPPRAITAAATARAQAAQAERYHNVIDVAARPALGHNRLDQMSAFGSKADIGI